MEGKGKIYEEGVGSSGGAAIAHPRCPAPRQIFTHQPLAVCLNHFLLLVMSHPGPSRSGAAPSNEPKKNTQILKTLVSEVTELRERQNEMKDEIAGLKDEIAEQKLKREKTTKQIHVLHARTGLLESKVEVLQDENEFLKNYMSIEYEVEDADVEDEGLGGGGGEDPSLSLSGAVELSSDPLSAPAGGQESGDAAQREEMSLAAMKANSLKVSTCQQ